MFNFSKYDIKIILYTLLFDTEQDIKFQPQKWSVLTDIELKIFR